MLLLKQIWSNFKKYFEKLLTLLLASLWTLNADDLSHQPQWTCWQRSPLKASELKSFLAPALPWAKGSTALTLAMGGASAVKAVVVVQASRVIRGLEP